MPIMTVTVKIFEGLASLGLKEMWILGEMTKGHSKNKQIKTHTHTHS